MTCIDLNSLRSDLYSLKEKGYAYRSNCFCPGNGLLSVPPFGNMYQEIRRRQEDQSLFVSGSTSVYDFCTAYQPRESAGYRDVSSRVSIEAFSHRYSLCDFSQYARRCERETGLANLCRCCTDTDQPQQSSLYRRRYGIGSRCNSLRIGCYDHRLVSLAFSMSKVSSNKGGHQASCVAQSLRKYPRIYSYIRCVAPRSQRLGYVDPATWSDLYYGSCLSRFSKALSSASSKRLLCDQSTQELQISSSLFASSGSIYRYHLRSDHRLDFALSGKEIPRSPQAYSILRYREKENHCFSDKQFSSRYLDDSQLYKARWQVDLFFKWIKQHLRIKAFYNTSSNAVKTQIWTAICAYLLVAIMKKELQINHSLYTILQILSISLFEQTPIKELLMQTPSIPSQHDSQKQLLLFDF